MRLDPQEPKLTILIVNPDNAYHWVQLKCSVEREEREGPGGERVTRQLDKIWTKYTGNPPPTACAIPRSTKSACCSSATSIASRLRQTVISRSVRLPAP